MAKKRHFLPPAKELEFGPQNERSLFEAESLTYQLVIIGLANIYPQIRRKRQKKVNSLIFSNSETLCKTLENNGSIDKAC